MSERANHLQHVRHRPAELFFAEAKRRRVGIWHGAVIRLLSQGWLRGLRLLTDDHRQFNRQGAAFDVGGFAGVDLNRRGRWELKALCPPGMTLRSCTALDSDVRRRDGIPGGKRARVERTVPPPTCRRFRPRQWRQCEESTITHSRAESINAVSRREHCAAKEWGSRSAPQNYLARR